MLMPSPTSAPPVAVMPSLTTTPFAVTPSLTTTPSGVPPLPSLTTTPFVQGVPSLTTTPVGVPPPSLTTTPSTVTLPTTVLSLIWTLPGIKPCEMTWPPTVTPVMTMSWAAVTPSGISA